MVKIAISFYEYQEVRDVTSVKLKKNKCCGTNCLGTLSIFVEISRFDFELFENGSLPKSVDG